ncbi:unnamed protein product [Lactuca saligna]|uniref:Uncharacterized protein n=1 Tax=Lactuca saligna TaxID=75948 RepID=A0AA35YLT3_LACSI|nr:unnamed protein product [Lactuca saligna]
MVVTASTSSQLEMTEAGRVETDCQKEIIFAGKGSNILDADATTDNQLILDGANSDFKSDDDQLNHQKQKASFLGGVDDAKAESCSTASDPSTPPLSKKRKLIFYLNVLVKV